MSRTTAKGRTIACLMLSLVGVAAVAPIVVLALPLWVVAFLTRRISALFEPKTVKWPDVIEFAPEVGWRPKPHLDAQCEFGPGVFHVTTDADGWRGGGRVSESDVVVFGDSFAFGFGVDERDWFAQLNPELRVKGVGAPGYNMVQALILMRWLSSTLAGKLVVWFVYHGNDLYDNLLPNLYHYRMPFVRMGGEDGRWEIVTGHVNQTRWPFNPENSHRVPAKYAATYGVGESANRAYSAVEFLLREGQSICRGVGSVLVVLSIPHLMEIDASTWNASLAIHTEADFDPDMPTRRIGEICLKLGIPFVSAKRFLTVGDHFQREGHWNPRGHRRIAKALLDIVERYSQSTQASEP